MRGVIDENIEEGDLEASDFGDYSDGDSAFDGADDYGASALSGGTDSLAAAEGLLRVEPGSYWPPCDWTAAAMAELQRGAQDQAMRLKELEWRVA
eukprot:5175794-Alexandrium_andersonii.AAC.1